MIFAALKTLTWGTVATAVVCALMLAVAGGGMPRIASITGDVMRGRLPAPTARADTRQQRTPEAPNGATPARDSASH
jgi:hypothetical protein